MGRRSSFSSRSSSKPSSRQTNTQTAPKPMQPTVPQTQTKSPGMLSGLMGTMFQGMAFGAGSEVAHQAIRSVTGSGSNAHSQQQDVSQTQSGSEPVQQQQKQAQCQMENSNFVECLKFNSNNISGCQDYLNMLKTCEQKF